MSAKPLVIIGVAPFADWAAATAREQDPGREVHILALDQRDRFQFDTTPLETLAPQQCDAFVALDGRAVNFSRLELVSMLKARGFALARLVSKGARVDPDQRLGENTMVQAGASVSADARVGYNVVIGAGCVIGPGVRIGNSAYLGAGVVIGAGAAIGDNTTIGAGVVIDAGVKIGKQCEISIPGVYGAEVPDKTFYAPGYAGPVRIVKF